MAIYMYREGQTAPWGQIIFINSIIQSIQYSPLLQKFLHQMSL